MMSGLASLRWLAPSGFEVVAWGSPTGVIRVARR